MSATERLANKLRRERVALASVYVAPHTRVVAGKLVRVGGYRRDVEDLMKRLVDYKPDRSLLEGDKVRRLDEVLPRTQYERYVDVPFFDDLNGLIGADLDTVEGHDYADQRERFFESLPTQDVSLDNIVVTQEFVNIDRVDQIRRDPAAGGSKALHVVRYRGRTYIMNGHHRLAAEVLNGKRSIRAKVLEL